MKLTVFGIGYVGLVQAAVFAEIGHDVVCVDVDAQKIAALLRGEIPIFEPDLAPMVQRNIRDGRLRFTTDAAVGVAHGSMQFIAVGTPALADGAADLRYVDDVAAAIAEHMRERRVVAIKSTVPVGTAARVRSIMAERLGQRGMTLGFDVVSNPEFLKEGAAVADCLRPERIIIGTDSAMAEQELRRAYAPLNRNHEKIIVMDVRSAELTKYAANAMLATKISFMNEMAGIAEAVGADIERVRQGIGSDPRIGYSFIYPGIGYGGSCFPKDVAALIHGARAAGVDPGVLEAVQQRNLAQKSLLVRKIAAYFDGQLKGRTFALWGLAFKPETDDMREAPSRAIMEGLWKAGAKVRAYDPIAMAETAKIYGERSDLEFAASREAALEGADALIVATEWKAFRSVDFARLRAALKHPAIFDGRNVYDPAEAAAAGIDYFGIGRGRSVATF